MSNIRTELFVGAHSRLSRAFLYISLCFGLTFQLCPFALAANINEFDYPDAKKLSGEASSESLEGISYVFKALGSAETGDCAGASDSIGRALSALGKSEAHFQTLAKEMTPRKINYEKASKIVSRDELRHMIAATGGKMPVTTTDLAFIALKQVSAYKSAVADLAPCRRESSRQSILRMSTNLHLLMDLGVAVSELADAAQ